MVEVSPRSTINPYSQGKFPQTVSRLYEPGCVLALLSSVLFLLAGIGSIFVIVQIAPPGLIGHLLWLLPIMFVGFGGLGVVSCLRRLLFPVDVEHHSTDRFTGLSSEPVVLEGSKVYGRLTHEIVEDPIGWTYGVSRQMIRSDKCVIFGFGIPFLIAMAGILGWCLHTQGGINLALGILAGIVITAISGGSALILIGAILFSGHKNLCCLVFQSDKNELLIEFPKPANLDSSSPFDIFEFLCSTRERQKLVVAQEQIAAIQLCPWKFRAGTVNDETIADAVQGVLVIAESDQEDFQRVPILLTMEFRGATSLMQSLSAKLQVPFLFYCDAQGWQIEFTRAKSRKPLSCGGVQS